MVSQPRSCLVASTFYSRLRALNHTPNMRPLVSRLSQVMRPIALDQRSKMLCQNRITSRSPLLGVLRLPAQRASFAPNHFASSQIRALHTTLQTRTPRDHKTEGRKATNKSGQPLKGSELSDREVWEKVKEMIISLSRIYPALQRDHDKVAKDVRMLQYLLWTVGIIGIVGEISRWYLGDDFNRKGSNPTSDEKHQKAEKS